MSVDLRKVKKLIELVEESGISELEVRDGEETIRIARHPGTAAAVPVAAPAPSPVTTRPGQNPGGFEVRTPMAGTFYRAPSPDAAPFVSVGQAVEPGDVLCIVESMKMMNEITAERSGVCAAVMVGNGEAIGTGQVLFRFQ